MSKYPKRPLKIYHHFDSSIGMHYFWTNKINLTAHELQTASIVTAPKVSPLFYAHHIGTPGDYTLIQRPYMVFERFKQLIKVNSFYPYHKITSFDANQIALPSKSGEVNKKGVGLNFELRAYKHLREFYKRGDLLVQHYTDKLSRSEMLDKLGISSAGNSHTVDQHIRKYTARINEIERKLTQLGHE